MGRYNISGHRLEISSRQKQGSPGGSDGNCWDDILQSERDKVIFFISGE